MSSRAFIRECKCKHWSVAIEPTSPSNSAIGVQSKKLDLPLKQCNRGTVQMIDLPPQIVQQGSSPKPNGSDVPNLIFTTETLQLKAQLTVYDVPKFQKYSERNFKETVTKRIFLSPKFLPILYSHIYFLFLNFPEFFQNLKRVKKPKHDSSACLHRSTALRRSVDRCRPWSDPLGRP